MTSARPKPDRRDPLEDYARALPRGGRQLPHGRHGLPRDFVLRAQRDRMVDAMAHAVARSGYADTAVKDVLELAGVSRRTFYEHFRDKHDCFVAAYDTLARRMLREALDGYESEREWPRRVRGGVAGMLGFFGREPAYARAGIVEVLAAGRAALERRDAALRGFAVVFDSARPEVPDHGLPPIVAEATIGGIFEVVYSRILREGPQALPGMLGDITYLALAPFVGHAEAARHAHDGGPPRGAGPR